jgi:RNA polymerase sigma factor (TIGR02999 family)
MAQFPLADANKDNSRIARDADLTEWLNQDADSRSALAAESGMRKSGASKSAAMFEMLYQQLRNLAHSQMRHERAEHTLSATGLAHEAWFRMAQLEQIAWQDRNHFMAVSATVMRRILLDHAIAKRAQKRDMPLENLTLTALGQIGMPVDTDIEKIHHAVLALEAVDMRAAKVVEMRFFAGFENEEVAEALGISLATVKRDWVVARAWLHRELMSS